MLLCSRLTAAAIIGAFAFACSTSSSTQPTTPTDPIVNCPADLSVTGHGGQPPTVSFDTPAPANGTPPVRVSCVPGSGTQFPNGVTTVTCEATDARARRASCSFLVTVTPVPQLQKTTFLAFGDSITEGLFPFLITPNPPGSYPAVLQSLLRTRYTAQADSIVVLDEGLGGQRAADPDEFPRFRDALNRDNAGAVLLMEGANDLNNGAAAGDAVAAIPALVSGLRAMVREARGRGLPVFVATLAPQRAGGPKAGAPGAVVPANDQIRSMVAAEGAVLVDVYQAFGGVPDPWIGSDGLHPSRVGLEKIAQTFYDILRARFEISAGP
jgi:lysophospholipase L1-like esterase